MKNLSYLNNANSAYIDSLYQLYKEDPASVEFGWQKFFEGFDFGRGSEAGVVSAETPDHFLKEIKVLNLIKEHKNDLERNSADSQLISYHTELFSYNHLEKYQEHPRKTLDTNQCILSILILILDKEKDSCLGFYEENPDRLENLNKLILASLKIYLVCTELKNAKFLKTFGSLVSILIKKQI